MAVADRVDSLESILRDNPQIQEKIYLHLDNNCYFVGDTLWYKAYVVTADNLHPTNMSKLLYVELLSPDGVVVERQHVVVSDKGHTCGQFALQDSLYSGYYEVRAYTKWQLNFNVTERYYSFVDERKFFNKQMCKDFFRDFEGLYSRVVPVYNKPRTQGDYADRYISKRPKQRVLKDKFSLFASFFPEGGHNVSGLKNTIAFEVVDQHGQCIDVEGTLSDGTKVKTDFMGRGVITLSGAKAPTSVTFPYNGKDYKFDLPEAENAGCAMHYDAETCSVSLQSKGVTPAAYAVLCRGRLVRFERLQSGTTSISLQSAPKASLGGSLEGVTGKEGLPTGVNEIIIYDSDAQPLASRLFFINNHDMGVNATVVLNNGSEVTKTTTLAPYDQVALSFNANKKSSESNLQTVSIAVRDAQTADPGYDDGNIMTDMLLSSELKGFVASPSYYFASDDQQHRHHLDLLMQVQGWRRYKRVEEIRYQPELTTTFEGRVYKIPSQANILEFEDMAAMKASTSIAEEMLAQTLNAETVTTMGDDIESDNTGISEETVEEVVEYSTDTDLVDGRSVRKEVLVEAEINLGKQSAGVIASTDKRGHFSIQIPPYYDSAILFVKAYNKKDSLNKSMASHKDSNWRDERAFPDYYVKRDMFFPIFSQPYSWYQCNSPEILFVDEEDDINIPANSRLAGDHMLQNVVVSAKRRGKRALDMTKPAIVRDAYELYNDVTDYGLSFGVVNMGLMPLQTATYLFGNMGRMTQFNIRAMVNGTSFYRNYKPTVSEFDKNMSDAALFDVLALKRIKDIRIFTDYELRTDSGDVQESGSADVTMDFVPVPDDGKRYTYRDRRYVFPGIAYPEEFYSPDYSRAIPNEPTDYRRTLYWNPNARVGEDGTFNATFYNNSRETRVRVSVAGIDSQGQMYY